MDLDQSFLSELPLQQRQKVCRQIRQRQIEKYLEFQKSDRGKEQLPRKTGRGNVNFPQELMLQNAVDNFDDRSVASCLTNGCEPNVSTGNGTSLLHRCAAEDNVGAGELLLSSGADVNILDDDWWTPLHTACSCDSPEMVNLLINNGADVTAIDVDGFFPVDQAGDGSEVKAMVTKHMESHGLTGEMLHGKRQMRAIEALNYIKGLPLATDINQLNEDGVTLLHIAAANGYKSCMKALFRYDASMSRLDSYGWTPLHVAARFNQRRSVELLLKQKANSNATDLLGNKPSAVTSSDEIRGLLMRHERKQLKTKQEELPVYMEISGDSDDTLENTDAMYAEIEDIDEQEPAAQLVVRINSKTARTKHLCISKEDELREAKQMYAAIADFTSGVPVVAMETDDGNNEEDEEDDDYISSAIWTSGGKQQGDLVACMDNDNLVTWTSDKDDAILSEIQKRYDAKQIYTQIGDVLIAVNPFQPLPYYAKDISLKYRTATSETKLPPHIYGIAEKSYKRLLQDRKSQCHVISGESGAGKSESCKYIIQHLLRVAGSEETNLNSKINQVNPLLEAFGNALTVMNNNSSRFGKYVELSFNQSGKVCGARITEYLLEKSRIVHQGKGEENFHIFYWMMAGLSPEESTVFKLDRMERFRYLKSSISDYQSSSENKAKFWEVKECLKYIGFSSTDIQNVLQMLSIVLHLGEIEFHGVGNNEAAQVLNTDMLNTVSDMMEVCTDELSSALVADYTVARGEQIKKERTVQQAVACRDALAKSLYARLFSWIVNGINQLIQPTNELGEEMQLGILDIFGFENFQHNSFEQICINVANEQIQMYTNDHIFHSEQQDCLLEGVPVVDLNYTNNQAILNLFFEKHTGLLAILDEESSFPKATDKSLATKLHQNTGKKHSSYYKTPKDGGLCFTVVHYAGCVTYDVTGVLEKNRDTLPNSILYTMKTSNRLLIKELFQSRITRTGSLAPSARQQRSRTTKKSSSPFEFFKKLRTNRDGKKPQKNISVEKKGPSTMTFHFRNSLNDLISKLQAANPHFVRCLKPNTTKSAFTYVPEYILAQLRYTGISEIVKIRKFGYALRLTFHEFLNRFNVLVNCCLPSFCPVTDIQKVEMVVLYYGLEHVQFGRTKVFLKIGHVDKLDKLTSDLEVKVTTAQAVVRGFLGRQKSRKLSATREQERQKMAFLQEVTEQFETLDTTLRESLKDNDHQFAHTGDETNEALNSLDEITRDYDDAFSVRCAMHDHDDDDDGGYDDAFSVQQHSMGEGLNEEDSMNGHLQRELPPTPGHVLHFDPSRPPPTPKEMYSQGMYAGTEDQNQYDHKRYGPPPPKRNPDTRLSTTSPRSSVSCYDEIHVQESPVHHHGNQQLEHHYVNQSPRHTSHGSPILRSKASHDPPSSSLAENRPFSYGAPILSPNLNRTTDTNNIRNQNILNNPQNGHSQQNVPSLPNYQYNDRRADSPVMHYGKHESAFHPQSHRPPPHELPPPVPPGHPSQGHQVTAPPSQYPLSPAMHRHSDAALLQDDIEKSDMFRSPKNIPRLSQRSKSVPCNPDEAVLPEPPPPLSVRENYLASALHTNRAPSPPLPPPPPEMLDHHTRQSQPAVLRNVPQNVDNVITQSLPNAAASMSPKHQAVLPPSHQTNIPLPNHMAPPPPQAPGPPPPQPPGPPPPPSLSSIPKKKTKQPGVPVIPKHDGPKMGMGRTGERAGGNSPEPSRGNKVASVSPPRLQIEHSLDQTALIQQINKVQLKKTEGETTGGSMSTRPAELSAVRLRQTTARIKLLENDGIQATNEAPLPEPLAEQTEAQQPASSIPPEPMAEPQQPAQVTPAVNMFKKKVDIIARADNQYRNQGDTSNDSRMDIDNIDLNDVPGYMPITKSTPIWKREMIEKKNQEKLEEYIGQKRQEKEVAEKWKNVPAWKRKLMMEKEKEKSQKSEDDQKKAAEEEVNKKRRVKEADDDRKTKIREQQEMEKRMQEELQDVPEWKREIMMKRGGAIKNWADEREDQNVKELEEEQARLDEMESRHVPSPSPPPQQPQTKKAFTQKAPVVLQESRHVPSPSPPPQQPQTKKAFTQKASVVLQPQQSQNKEPVVKKAPALRPSIDESRLEDEWESLPLWKREIMMKRGGAPSNWGDEREEVNEEEENVEQ